MLRNLVLGVVLDILADLEASAVNPVLRVVATLLVATPSVTDSALVRGLWGGNAVLANSLLVLFVVAGGFVVASQETLQTQTGLREIAPRVVLAAVLVNCSLIIAREAIALTNAISSGVLGQGVDEDAAAESIHAAIGGNGPDLLGALFGLVALVLLIVLVATYVVRVGVLLVLLVLAPLMLLCHALPQTERLAALWWRAFLACLGVQIVHAVVLLFAVGLLLTPTGPRLLGVPLTPDGWLQQLLLIVVLWLMIRVPFYARQLVFSGNGGRGLVSQVVRAYFLWRTVGSLVGTKGAGASRSAAAGRGTRPASGNAGNGPRRSSRSAGPARSGGASAPRRAPAQPPTFSSAPATQRSNASARGSTAAASAAPPTFSHAPAVQRATPNTRGRAGAVPATPPTFSDPASAQRGSASPRPRTDVTPATPPAYSGAPSAPPHGASARRRAGAAPAERPAFSDATVPPREHPAAPGGAAPRRRSRQPHRTTWAEATGTATPPRGRAEWLPPAPPRIRRPRPPAPPRFSNGETGGRS
ncbi:hypothetical protein [Cryptosporangium sp. NPDC048952]|uniref:hypothetical protein n=1 Tax=Cryptosporangium sp. NPDC048952 TaxID=3363961 RepID=UPI0037179E76